MHGVQVGLMPWWDDPEASLADATCSQFPGAASQLFWSGMHTVGPNGLRMGSGNPVAANAESLSDSTTKSFCHDIPNPCPVNLNPRSAQNPPNLHLPSKTGAIPVRFSMCPKRVPLPSSSTFGSGVACHSLQKVVCCLCRLIRFSQGGYSLGLHSPVSTLLVLRQWGADKKG